MARRVRRKKTARRTGTIGRIVLVLLLLVGGGAAWGWYKAQHWRPDEARWSDQGALLGEAEGAVDFGTLKGLGAKFAYLEASIGAGRKDITFADNLAAARQAGLQIGAVHLFDPCLPADAQSANFVTIVPRDADLLPPVIALRRTAEDCPRRVVDAAVQSEVLTLVNQIEAHTGKPVILAPDAAFEEKYGIARRIDRQLWLSRDWLEPGYAGRPWLLWTANSMLATEASDEPLRWVVVRP